MARLIEFSGTATVIEQSTSFAGELEALLNDGDEDIVFGLDAPTTSSGTRTVKPGEQYEVGRFPVPIKTLYYRAAANTSTFRAWAVRN